MKKREKSEERFEERGSEERETSFIFYDGL